MIPLILIATLLGVCLNTFFSEFSYLSVGWHPLCLTAAPDSPHQALYQALICGQRLAQPEYGLLFKELGLIHIFVVSGAHLHFLDRLLRWTLPWQRSPFLRLPLLFAFVLLTGVPITAFRAWFYLFLKELNLFFKLSIPSFHRLLLSVVFCLGVFPQEYASRSLCLSWMACLGILLGRHIFTQSFLIYFLTWPILQSFQSLSLWTIVVNSLFAPWIGTVFFPMSLLSFLLPWLTPLTDQLWSLLLWTLQSLLPHVQSSTASFTPWPDLGLWFFCLTLHWLFYQRQRWNRC